MTDGRTVQILESEWLARADPDELGERYPEELHYTHEPDARWMRLDLGSYSGNWKVVEVPQDWSSYGFVPTNTVWFRTTFDRPAADCSRWCIEFAAVDYEADIWLNEIYLGSHVGGFEAFSFGVTDLLQRSGNVLALRVHTPKDALGQLNQFWQLKRTFRGGICRCDTNDPELRPGGITGPVSLSGSGPARLDDFTVRMDPLGALDGMTDESRALVVASATLSTSPSVASDATPPEWEFALELRGVEGPGRSNSRATDWVRVAEGRMLSLGGPSPITLSGVLEHVDLWWTWDLGEQPLYDARLQVWRVHSGHGDQSQEPRRLSDELILRTAARRIERGAGWDLRLNGFSIYQRGANYLSDQLLSSMTTDRYVRDVELMRAANLNTAHVFNTVERPTFYDECDRQGILIYQDLPIWMMSDPASEVVREGVRQFGSVRHQLCHHPSIAIWNMGTQPSVANFEKLCSALVRDARRTDPTRVAAQGNTTLDYEPYYTHPVGSFFWTRETAHRLAKKYAWQWDTHIYAGWYFDEPSLEEVPIEDFQFVTEFGAQALPDARFLAEHFGLTELNDATWDRLTAKGLQPRLMSRHIPPVETLEELVLASQSYQSSLLRHHTETYRRKKFRPSRGAHVFLFADCRPFVSWSVLDYERTPKAAYGILSRAMSPVQVFLDRWPTLDDGSLHLTIVNDTRRQLSNVQLEVRIGDALRAGLALDVRPNEVRDLDVDCGGAMGAPITLRLLDEAQIVCENTYSQEEDSWLRGRVISAAASPETVTERADRRE